MAVVRFLDQAAGSVATGFGVQSCTGPRAGFALLGAGLGAGEGLAGPPARCYRTFEKAALISSARRPCLGRAADKERAGRASILGAG